jgi:hypothetical protein
MNISQYKEAIKICMNAGVPLMAWGPGGVGKSEGPEQIAKEMNIGFEVIEAPLIDPSDILGLPDISGDKTVFKRPALLPDSGKGILLIDELPDSELLLQKALYHLILKNEVKGHKVPKEWYIMGAGNRPEDFAMSNPIPAPLITRMSHVGVACSTPDFTECTPKTAEIDCDDYTDYFLKSKFHPVIIAWIKTRPDLIYKNQATPRTYEFVSRLLYNTQDHFSFVFKEIIQGVVGVPVGTLLNSFIKLAIKIPSVDAIIKNPDSVEVPTATDIIYTLVCTLIAKTKKETATNIIKYVHKLREEFQFFYFLSVRKTMGGELLSIPEWRDWLNTNAKNLAM